MGRMSANILGKKVDLSAQQVYDMWKDMGLVIKDTFGDWALTDAGRKIGGQMSKSAHLPVPTFEIQIIEKLMIEFYKKLKK